MRRFAFAPLALSLAAASFASPSSGSPAGSSALRTPQVLSGALTVASTRPALDVAREVVARHATLRAELTPTVRAVAGGANVVELQQTIEGVPVLYRGAQVFVEADGRATLATLDLEERRPTTVVPTLDAKSAIAIAARQGIPASAQGARLLVVSTGGEPRLVYGVVGDLGPLPTRPVVLLDAHTGEVVVRWDAALSANKAKVYADNPEKTPTTSEVTLANDATKEGLQSEFVVALNCIDKKTVRDLDVGAGFPISVHTCDLVPTITPGADGDYLEIAPAGGTAAEDKYAELSMFHHVSRVFDFAKGIGLPAAAITKVNAIANLRMPAGFASFDLNQMKNPDLALVPFDNAFFAAQDPLLSTAFGLTGDAMWFGQGTTADFGYDGDVVYHEFGHYIVSKTLRLDGSAHTDKFGSSFSPGALNEGIADVISFFITDDPELGEYTGKFVAGSPKGKGMRSAVNSFAFPAAITGEVHQDGEPFVAAVWKVYSTLTAAKKVGFQKAFMKALNTAPKGSIGFEQFDEVLQKAVGTDVDAASATALETEFKARGLERDNPRVRPYVDGGVSSIEPRLGIHTPGKKDVTARGTLAPGVVQIRYDAPAGGLTKLHVAFSIMTRGGAFGGASNPLGGSSGTKFTPVLLAKVSADPISFTYAPTTADGATFACTVTATSGVCDAEVEVAGNWGETSPVHLMIANSGDQAGDYDDVVITAEGPPEPAPQPAAEPTTTTTTTGCGCTLPGGAAQGTTATFALAALGLALARRRSVKRG